MLFSLKDNEKPLKKWVRRLKKGDQSAFLPLYERTSPGLMRFLLWKTNGDRPTCEDILQESYVRFLLNIDNIESDEDKVVQAYLLRIVRHCLIDKVARSPHASRRHVPIEEAYGVSDTAADARQEKAVELRELQVAMQGLNEKDSEIIWLRDAMGMSHREVADNVGISEQASRQAYVRAKKALFSELSTKLNLTSEEVPAYAVPELS